MGDSKGTLGRSTLVVDTRTSSRQPEPNGGTLIALWVETGFSGAPGSAENLHLVGHFTLVDAETLLYEFTVNDLTTWERPWAVIPMVRSDGELFERACHEGNYGMTNLLAGACDEEQMESQTAHGQGAEATP